MVCPGSISIDAHILNIMAGTEALPGVNRNTAKAHLRELVRRGYLIQHGAGRATWYPLGKCCLRDNALAQL